jgi:hypothetical protein
MSSFCAIFVVLKNTYLKYKYKKAERKTSVQKKPALKMLVKLTTERPKQTQTNSVQRFSLKMNVERSISVRMV